MPLKKRSRVGNDCKQTPNTARKGETASLCCNNGKVQLPNLEHPPELLEYVMLGETADSKHFLENIRKYNSCFQMTSFGSTKKLGSPDICQPSKFKAKFTIQ